MGIIQRFKNAFNIFRGRSPTRGFWGWGDSMRPDRVRLTTYGIRSMVNTAYTQISVDCSSIDIKHVRLNEKGKYKETINDDLNYALTKSANIDQTGRELIRDAVLKMLDYGCVAIVPIETDDDPWDTDSYKIYTLRTGKIVQWYPKHVLVELYNELRGKKQEFLVEKRTTAIIENPFYPIMNEPSSTAQQLMSVLNKLEEANDNQVSKINLLIHFPYSVKDTLKKLHAERRRKDIEHQLIDNRYGVAYLDSNEKVTQLNRPIENNLWEQAISLKDQLMNELGLTKAIFDGTADEQTMLNYQNRTLEPILSAITENMERKWISLTAQTQGQAIRYFKNPFKLVPVGQIAEIADKFTRNEIMTSNEMRAVIGLEPVDDPKANELRNANLNHPDEEGTTSTILDEVVEHHGIKGQHWGIRNGPPYPLDDKSSRSKNLLSKYDRYELTDQVLDKYKNQYSNLKHLKIDKNTKGKIYIDSGKVVGIINTEKKTDGSIWIQGLELFGDYKGKGLSRGMLEVATKELKATNLSVRKTNYVAKKIYDEYGFDVYDSDDYMYYMKKK